MIILKDIIIAPQIITMNVENLLHFHPFFEMHLFFFFYHKWNILNDSLNLKQNSLTKVDVT